MLQDDPLVEEGQQNLVVADEVVALAAPGLRPLNHVEQGAVVLLKINSCGDILEKPGPG